MTTKRRAVIGFKKMKDDELLRLASTVYQAMTGNPNFPNPNPDLPELDLVKTDFDSRLGFSKQKGGFYEASLKNDSRRVLENTLKQIAFHVNIESDGNLSAMLSSGFPLTSDRATIFVPEIPLVLRLRDGRQSGYMRFGFEKVPNTVLYEYQVASEKNENAELEWGERLTTTSSINNIISPVTPGVSYYVRVRAINGKGIGDWSEPVMLMAR